MVDEQEDEDVEAGPEMPPDDEVEGPEDEEGRFFGGGITRNTADVLDFMEEQDQDEVVRLVLVLLLSNTKVDKDARNLKGLI